MQFLRVIVYIVLFVRISHVTRHSVQESLHTMLYTFCDWSIVFIGLVLQYTGLTSVLSVARLLHCKKTSYLDIQSLYKLYNCLKVE